MKVQFGTPMPRVPRKAVSELRFKTECKYLAGKRLSADSVSTNMSRSYKDLRKNCLTQVETTLTRGVLEVFKALSVQKRLG